MDSSHILGVTLNWFAETENLALVVAGVSFLAFIYLGVKNHKLQGRILTLEEARRADEQDLKRKADLVAWTKQETGPRSHRPYWYLYIENNGPALARDISIKIDDVPILEHPAFSSNSQKPMRKLGPGGPYRYLFNFSEKTPPVPWSVVIKWTDDSEERGVYKTTIGR